MAFPDTLIGQTIGNYQVVALLGSGGMGSVYRAVDVRLGREVALKVLRREGLERDPEAEERFRREARALAKLNHPHIASLYDVVEQDGFDTIVMECVEGESLAAKLDRGELGVREATEIIRQVAEALEEAHAHGVIHRDIKPANVMITPRGQAKVLDFGVAKLLAARGADVTQSIEETRGVMGTPRYMSPEQALGEAMDARTDVWSLGVLYYEARTDETPFNGNSAVAILRAIADDPAPPVRELREDVPALAEQIVARALEKDREKRYPTATAMMEDLSRLLGELSGTGSGTIQPLERARLPWRAIGAVAALALVALGLAGWLVMRRAAERRWAREEAIPEMQQLVDARKPLAALLVLERAEKDLPGDARLLQVAGEQTERIGVTSDPAGASVEIADYLAPDGPWRTLGTTPLAGVRVAKGYFRWRVTKSGVGTMVTAPETAAHMNFALGAWQKATAAGMVEVPGGLWTTYDAFIGWVGPYNLPGYQMDRYEVTNSEFQKFVESGGYEKSAYWPEFERYGKKVEWAAAMAEFRDTTGRPGPATWTGGHYPEGQGNFPVSGVSWYEATAYAAWAGKSLPVLGQWYKAADPDMTEYTAQESNMGGTKIAAVGAFHGLGTYGTEDTAGNVREWVENEADKESRFIMGGSWRETPYLAMYPQALTPWDRSDVNGLRCVRNREPVPAAAAGQIPRVYRDFAHYKPVSDEVFRAYELLYAYPKSPLNAQSGGVVQETEDWKEEKVTFDTAYGERMAAYLFLPKRVKPPYQTVLFFPSARVMFQPPDSSHLGDVQFFDYIVQSGRAVMYPVYQDMYERRLTYRLPGGGQGVELTAEWYKDAARALDYLATRTDIDNGKLAYLGVSAGAADGAIVSTLLQDRLKAAIYLDGGYFLAAPPPGGDQADFAPRMKKPVLMVNGRYDYTFPVETAQDPMFAMLGTPAADKQHVVLDTPHDVTERRPQLVAAVLAWLDRYLGRVGE
jgi:formylglycine-generating enzyme required for sulfatase activity/dienelactone hydrolase/predicted Ser/Thr protein kinase